MWLRSSETSKLDAVMLFYWFISATFFSSAEIFLHLRLWGPERFHVATYVSTCVISTFFTFKHKQNPKTCHFFQVWLDDFCKGRISSDNFFQCVFYQRPSDSDKTAFSVEDVTFFFFFVKKKFNYLCRSIFLWVAARWTFLDVMLLLVRPGLD